MKVNCGFRIVDFGFKPVEAGLKPNVFALLFLLFAINNLNAQNVNISATVDTSKLLIGQQRNLKVNVTADKTVQFSFPVIKDSIGRVEIISTSKIDTLANDASKISLQQNIVITCFDTGFIPVQPISVGFKKQGDTTNFFAESQAFLLTVSTVAVDTTKAFRDIKPPIEVSLTLADFLPYIIGGVLLIVVIWLVIYFIRKRKNKFVPAAPKIPSRPAHEIALEELNQLREEKLWQQGNIKLYFTKLTDIVRMYIEHRYHVNAMEFTTDEILSSAVISHLDADAVSKLRFTLITADIVKFAKGQPLASENELSMSNCYDFVNQTKDIPAPVTELKAETA